jgi:DNA-binding LacI/PurR family transcriptional regulator
MHLLLDAVDNSSEDAYIDLLTPDGFDGLILIDVPLNAFVSQRLIRNNFPVVTFGYQYPERSSIDAENWLGAKKAVEHLDWAGPPADCLHHQQPSFPGDPSLRLQGTTDRAARRGPG